MNTDTDTDKDKEKDKDTVIVSKLEGLLDEHNESQEKKTIYSKVNSSQYIQSSKLFQPSKKQLLQYSDDLNTTINEILDQDHEKKMFTRWSTITAELQSAPSWVIVMLYLLSMGTIVALIGTSMDILIDLLHHAQNMIILLSPHIVVQGILWILFVVVLVLFSITVTRLISPAAAGSGVPQMKVILSGVEIDDYFKSKTLLAKFLGLVSFLGSGIISGKEGAFIHLAGIIAHKLAQLPIFSFMFWNWVMRERAYSAATALGVSANWGAPISGVLFSIEVTSVYYPTRTYWFVSVASVTGALLYRIFWNLYLKNINQPMLPYIPSAIPSFDGAWVDIVVLSIFGCILGLVGGLFTISLIKFLTFRQWLTKKLPFHPLVFTYAWVTLGALITGILTFPGIFPFLGLTSTGALKQLINTESLGSPTTCSQSNSTLNETFNCTPQAGANWIVDGSIFLGLLVFIISRIPLQLIAMSIPAPGGLYAPVTTLGAALGRMLGEAMNIWLPGKVLSPAAYAIVGAGALPGSVTGAISTALVIMELTGDCNTIILAFISTLLAVHVSRILTDSAYNALIVFMGLPYLPDLDHLKYTLTAGHMAEPIYYLEQISSLKDFRRVLSQLSAAYKKNSRNFDIPVVTQKDNPLLIGGIYYDILEQFSQKLINSSLEEAIKLGLDKNDLNEIQMDITQSLSKILHGIPIQFSPSASIVDIHHQFVVGHLSNSFITKKGLLVGMITRAGLKEAITKKKNPHKG